MSEIYTIVKTSPETEGWACHGRMSRADAIEQARDVMGKELERIRAFLATPNDELTVEVVRGIHVQHLIKVLEP